MGRGEPTVSTFADTVFGWRIRFPASADSLIGALAVQPVAISQVLMNMSVTAVTWPWRPLPGAARLPVFAARDARPTDTVRAEVAAPRAIPKIAAGQPACSADHFATDSS